MPRHKGRVERGVDFAQEALKGRSFGSLAAENTFLAEWEKKVADTRLHGTTRRQVGEHFLAVEKPALQPLPASIFPSFTEGRRRVHLDGHVEFDKAYSFGVADLLGGRAGGHPPVVTIKSSRRGTRPAVYNAARQGGVRCSHRNIRNSEFRFQESPSFSLLWSFLEAKRSVKLCN
jgi:hypothetical protein